MTPALPIDAALDEVLSALSRSGHAVLQAPPGAGKTTRVPLALLHANLVKGRILMLEPRRLAARAAAARMAETLGERCGQRVGYRIRGEARISDKTRIEVVTEGILTRMIQSDPDLPGVGAVIFDEFHERSLHADLGLALALEARDALRDDLVLLVMSATLDAGPVAQLLGNAPIVTCEGRIHPVETRWLKRSWRRPGRQHGAFEIAMADLIANAAAQSEGDILAFVPGEREIRRIQGLLPARLPPDIAVRPLFGALDFAAQQAALAPLPHGRKLVLATSIAETSLTIEGVRVVIDGGLARRARFDPGSGMSRLMTGRVTRAEAEQRRGRAGRVAPGMCFRLWTTGEEGALAPFPVPEIAQADLAPMVLECALWGARDPAELAFLTTPPQAAVARARALLAALGAVDDYGAITAHGREIARLPLHPRLGHMVLRGGADARHVAVLLSERDILSSSAGGPPPCDLALRIAALRDPAKFEAAHPFRVNRALVSRMNGEIARLPLHHGRQLAPGELAALAFPDRIAQRRKGDAPRYLLSGGKGAFFADPAEPLAKSRLIVACNLDGDRREAKIRLAAGLSETALRALAGTRIENRQSCVWSSRDQAVVALRQQMLGAIVLAEERWRDCPSDLIAGAMIDGLRSLGIQALGLPGSARLLAARVEWARTRGAHLPDFSDSGLMQSLADWLGPALGRCWTAADLRKLDLAALLRARLGYRGERLLDSLAPAHFTAPTGTRVAIDYGAEQPKIAIRLQELFGIEAHPCVGPRKTPVLIELLSPARRPVQTTADLPGFWQTSYKDVRKDMRGRYPKHPWPENPAASQPTRRTKRR